MPKRFANLDGSTNAKSFSQLRQWQKERRSKKKDFTFVIPRVSPSTELLANNSGQSSVTFIGHSTFMVQLGGLNIVTDPVWATRMGLGARLTAPGVPIEQMPPIDVVVLSHAHYDHLHLGSLRRLSGDFVMLVPEGLGAWMKRKGFSRVEEFSWWQTKQIGGVDFSFVPAKHWTRRTPWDMNTSHWGGWIMQHEQNCLYFAGDSGYDEGLFKEIGSRFDSIDVALMPIGAYEPEWFMRDSHMSPEEAVQSFLDVHASIFVPMHYDAFHLADDTPKEALDRLLAEWKRRELAPERLWTMELGRTQLWKD